MEVSQLLAKDIQSIVEELRGKEGKVQAEVATRLKKVAEKLENTLDAELQLTKAYLMTKKRYPLETLLSDGRELLAAGAFDTLAPNAVRDFAYGCKQVALSQPTAAAFHLMRMLEEQVKVLYFAFKKTKRLEKPMWGPMTNELKAKKGAKPSEKLLSHLDMMRVHFRNPTQHPQAFYTLDEAQDLLSQTVVAVNMIAAELPV